MSIRVFLLCIGLLAVGCATPIKRDPKSLLMHESTSVSPAQNLSAEESQADIDLLLYALDEGYIGSRYAPERELKAARKTLVKLAGSNLTHEDFCKGIAAALQNIRDRHLTAAYDDKRCDPPRSPEGSVGQNLAQQSGWGFIYRPRTVQDNNVAVFAISEFSDPEGQSSPGKRTLERLEEAFRYKPAAVVIDLRGNRGGYQDLQQFFTRIFYSPLQTTSDRPMERRLLSLEAMYLLMNDMRSSGKWTTDQWREVQKIDAPLMQSYMEFRTFLKNQGMELPSSNPPQVMASTMTSTVATEAESSKVTNETWDSELSLPRFSGPLYLVVDNHCASACERMLEDLEGRPQTWVVGQKTAGAVRYTHTGLLVLPKSGVQVAIPTVATFYDDQREIEPIGYEPQIIVRDGTDALEVAINTFSMRWLLEQDKQRAFSETTSDEPSAQH